jgi:hypothetical protein
MLIVDLSNDTRFYYTLPDGNYEIENYPFVIRKEVLKEIGETIETTRKFIPSNFDGSFQNIISNIRGTRAVDYLDFAFIVSVKILY